MSSSRKSTPCVARLASPGRNTVAPPPSSPAVEIEWWGARNGRDRRSPRPVNSPATEWSWLASSASSRVGAGRIEGRRRASIVLPAPGEPTISRLWPPAAATSSARRACCWPRTSARSTPSTTSVGPASGVTAGGDQFPLRSPTTSRSDGAPTTRSPSTCAASRAFASGTTTPSRPATCGRDGHREHARGRQELALERQLARERPAARPRGPSPGRSPPGAPRRSGGRVPALPSEGCPARGSPRPGGAATRARRAPPRGGSAPGRPGPPCRGGP